MKRLVFLLAAAAVASPFAPPASLRAQSRPASSPVAPTSARSDSDAERVAAERAAARRRILDIARAYAEYRWKATEAHVHHGPDQDGNQVDTHLEEVQIADRRVTAGTYELGDQNLPSHRVEARLTASLLSRGTHYPVTLEVEASLSDEVPVEGLLEVQYHLRIDYGQGRFGEIRQGSRLVAFHDPNLPGS